ncbi:HET-C-related protein [Pseudomonas sp. RP23018S]|uniref:HET-C-related protein n=1 Tax=Pseudomonas sp. RP23018S TaxID=3096037 RepID=UPI002ACA6718|nr:HET-C-related protein [Pseudomonas sp. RP23018S]MDZ5603484.1 HET-C-related protein [Pseudomonas sp. RP23018S]
MAPLNDNEQNPLPTLHSTFALEQFKSSAQGLTAQLFTHRWRPLFGAGIEPKHFVRLHKSLRDDSLGNVACTVSTAIDSSTVYDTEQGVIQVSQSAIEQALSEPQATPSLLLSLTDGFAYYIKAVLEDYQHTDGDAPTPTQVAPDGFSTLFVQTLLFYNTPVQSGTVFATYVQGSEEQPLTLSLASEPPYILEFGSGTGDTHGQTSFGHESIEYVLNTVGFDKAQCKAIYFGNWLRDYSQVIDPKLITPHGQAAADATEIIAAIANGELPRISRKKLTAIVDLFALKEFNDLQTTPQGREAYTVTPERLGVYLAHEHIDNPTTLDPNAEDPRTIDPAFGPLILPGDIRNKVLPKRSLKRYIRRPIAYMSKKIKAVEQAGMTPDGLRYFGEALHVLEDYFAHSNYVELLLRKLGHEDVLVWTTRIEDRKESRHEYPVITGLFGTLDILSSALDPLADLLYPADTLAPQNLPAGERSDFDKAMLILLEDEAQPLLSQAYQAYLSARDALQENSLFKFINQAKTLIELPSKTIAYATGLIKRPLLKWAGDHVATLQVHLDRDPNTDASAWATHSQLAKDHGTHPFHTLAVLLAREAVREMGQAMFDHWSGDVAPSGSLVALAESFIVHPNDSERFTDLVNEWAQGNADKIEQGKSLETLRTLQTDELDQVLKDINGALQAAEEHVNEIEELTNTSFWTFTNVPDLGPGYST